MITNSKNIGIDYEEFGHNLNSNATEDQTPSAEMRAFKTKQKGTTVTYTGQAALKEAFIKNTRIYNPSTELKINLSSYENTLKVTFIFISSKLASDAGLVTSGASGYLEKPPAVERNS